MGFFQKFKEGLDKTRAFLQNGITKITANLGYFDDEMLDELEELLLLADLGMPLVLDIMDFIREDIKKNGDNSKDHVLSLIKFKIEKILQEPEKLELNKEGLTIILMVGVNGTGKTTTIGKLCYRYIAENKKILVAAADTFRAAAIEQLASWTSRLGADLVAKEQGIDPASVVYEALDKAQSRQYDILMIDTAGRLHNKKNLMDELGKIARIIKNKAPQAKIYSLLVLDATSGQNAVLQAKYFNEVCHLDGLVITKLDSNSKGGITASVCHETKLPYILPA